VFQTKARSTAYATQIALAEIGRIRDELISDADLTTAKNSFIEGFPARFPNAGAISGALAAEELTGHYQRDPMYFAEIHESGGRRHAEDVQRWLAGSLDPQKMTFLFVGNAAELVQARRQA